MTLLRATAPYSACKTHVMGLWCAGHFHIHCSEEASLLEYPLMVSNASSESKSDHVRQLFVLLCEYMGFCLEDSSGYLGPRNFLTWLDYYVLCTRGYMFKELLNKSLSLWFVRETTSTYKYRVLYDMGQWPFPLTIWSGFSLIAKRTYMYMYIAQN